MQSSLGRVDRQPQATDGNRWQSMAIGAPAQQGELPIIGAVDLPQMLPATLVARVSFQGCLIEAARHDGRDDCDIAADVHVSAPYFSRLMRGTWEAWAKRLVRFCRATKSLAPLQWLADQLGCDVVPRAGNTARIRELEAELAALRMDAA